ncbi:hypothetical protein CABS01_10262 [Colletotrichum abscissum]|uniref:Uncharacterized protein n=1 Tax=Colletotrichum abscissum TaxID=1671311 RepID=A0A9P9XND5_9PEZI|nr:uncharacterized protein CABS01_10262 [Colletotrichum abscissum]KAI3557024.1 hypothetical protein CABS02_02575 [Colletotrichum abscissum]KAK1499864.1 hypothetical protein CABS01_10262 [Colletotrichum abscissum]
MTRHHRPTALHLATVLALLSVTTNLPGLMLVPGVAAVEDLEAEDVPPECAQVCAPIVQLTARCEAQVEAQFGKDKRDLPIRQYHDGSVKDRDVKGRIERRGDGKKRRRRNLQRMLGRRLSGRQEPESEDSSDDEEEPTASLAPGSGFAAVPTLGVGRSASAEDAAKEASEKAAEAAAKNASRACVCGERGFDVAGAAFGCLSCISRNVTAVEANGDIREVIGECGFVAAPAAPVPAPPVTISTTTTSSPPIVPPPVLNPAVTTTLPANLAPALPFSSSSTSSSSSSVPLPPASAIPPAIQTSTSTTAPPPTIPPAVQTPSTSPTPPPPSVPPVNGVSSAPSSESITPVTVFVPPNFQTLPSIVPPNDFRNAPSLPDANGNQMSSAEGRSRVLRLWGAGGAWVVILALVILG